MDQVFRNVECQVDKHIIFGMKFSTDVLDFLVVLKGLKSYIVDNPSFIEYDDKINKLILQLENTKCCNILK